MIDLHTHSIFSDGVLIPAELVRRAAFAGYKTVVITDHADQTTMGCILERLRSGLQQMAPYLDIDVHVGIELTHVPPPLIPDMVQQARHLGAQLVVVHGETLAEPVARGTNLAALEAGADVLAHPGLISEHEVRLAAERGVALELSTRKGHCLSNGHVARLAGHYQARLVVNNDAHAPEDFISSEQRKRIALGAGLTDSEYARAEETSREIVQGLLRQLIPST
jgi:histidinol phosphatase-like PHP family hydrolase